MVARRGQEQLEGYLVTLGDACFPEFVTISAELKESGSSGATEGEV